MIEITIFTLEHEGHTPPFRAYPPATARRILETKAAPPSHLVRVPADLDIESALDAAYVAGNGFPAADVRMSQLRRTRSTSIGDLMLLHATGQVFLVASFGFEPMFTLSPTEVQALLEEPHATQIR